MGTKKYTKIYVSTQKPNATGGKEVLSMTLPEPLTSKEIASMISKQLGTTFCYNGQGKRISYKANANKQSYYILSIS